MTIPALVPKRLQCGLGLVELLVAMLIGSVVLMGLIQFASSSRDVFQLHEN